MKALAESQRHVNFAFSGACHRSHDRGFDSRGVVTDVLEQAGHRVTFVCVAMLASMAFPGCMHCPTNESTAKLSSLSSADGVDSDHGDDAYSHETPSAVESIYIFRTLLEKVVTPMSKFCDDAGFVANSENLFSLWSLESEKDTGLLRYAHSKQIGDLRVCTGPSPEPTALNLYARASINHIPVVAKGVTGIVKNDFPTKGDTVREVAAAITAPGYIGGQLATNTIRSSVPGYVVASIGTMRLWKAP